MIYYFKADELKIILQQKTVGRSIELILAECGRKNKDTMFSFIVSLFKYRNRQKS